MAQLQDLENEILLITQQPGSNPGGAPSWPVNSPITQAVADFFINRGYERLCADLNQYEIADVSFTITSVASTFKYAYNPPPAGKAPISLVHRIFYAPVGLTYTYEYKPGYNFVSWDSYQKKTAQGYLQQTSATSTLPQYSAIDNLRQNLYFWYGSANSGDTITFVYAGLPAGTTTIPLLANETDTPIFPQDCHQAIVFYAAYLAWMRLREAGQSDKYLAMYTNELGRLKQNYHASHRGDITQFDLVDWDLGGYPGMWPY